jgi:LPS sulfotransferase NodH
MEKPRLSYVICTGPRTGSSLLCAGLWHTGLAGRPAEYFDVHMRNEEHWRKQLAVRNDCDYLGRVLNAATTSNGVFGLKLHWHQTPALLAKLLAERQQAPLPELPARPGAGTVADIDRLLRARLGDIRYVWLRRKNKVAQAISYYRASQSDLWRVPAAGGLPDQSASAVAFDYHAIDTCVRDVIDFDRGWQEFFLRQRLRALVVIYEDFIQTNEKTIHGILSYLGLDDPNLIIAPPQYLRQADDVSAEWESRYVAMAAAAQAGRTSTPEPVAGQPAAPRYTPSRKARARRLINEATADKEPAAPVEQAASQLPLIAYDLGSGINLVIEPAPPTRPWMDATPMRFAYRCLPLVIANQSGWWIRNAQRLTVTWDGTAATDGLRISWDGGSDPRYALSHFGSGILTFNLGCLFRTPPGYNLYIRGPANWPKDGIYALEGIVETDWNQATFTVNWKLTRPGHPVIFESDEPIAMISPLPRNNIERFRPQVQPISANPAWQAGYQEWSHLRSTFNAGLKAGQPEAVAAGWQRHYLQGVTVGDSEAPEHQTALSLEPFPDWPSARP